PDDDPVVAKPQDRGNAVDGLGLQDLEPVIRRPALQAAETAVEIGAGLVGQYTIGAAAVVDMQARSGRRVPVDPGKPLTVKAVARPDAGIRRAALHSGGIALVGAEIVDR